MNIHIEKGLLFYLCLVVTFWERTGLLALFCGVWLRVCLVPIDILGQVWYLAISIPDLCTLSYTKLSYWTWDLTCGFYLRN